jgi:SAM-dependent methyltransferase
MKKMELKHRIANFIGNFIKRVKSGYFGRQRYLLTALIYNLLPYFGYDYSRLDEYKFVLKNLPKGRLKILEVGCAESLFIYELAARRYDVYGLDMRPYGEKLPKTIKFSQQDIVNTNFPDSYFDAVIAISVIEHVGIGYYDARRERGDILALREMKRILKPGGRILITTLIGNKFVPNFSCRQRIYDLESFQKLCKGFNIEKEEYLIFSKKWRKTDKLRAFSQDISEHFALALIVLKKEDNR